MGDVLMRLIDADKLYDEIAQYRDENMFGGGNLLVDDILEDINLSPTVDAEPVRHGKWLMESDGGTRCSSCKKKVHDVTDGSYAPVDLSELPYCPKCGCKMDGE